MSETQVLINYWARNGYWKQLQNVCNDALKKRGDDPVLIFWKAFGILNEGGTSEAIREFESINGKRDLQLAVTSALIDAHSKFSRIDEETVEYLNNKLKDDFRATNEKGLMLAAHFHWLNGNHEKAREYAKTVMDSQPQYAGAQILQGWIDLTSGRDSAVKRSVTYFDKALVGNKKEIEALLGKAKYFESKKEYSQSLEVLNSIIVLYSWFLPALTEKAKILVMLGDWDQAFETVQRVVSQDSYNIEALRTIILYHLTRETKPAVVQKRMSDLIQAFEINEPKNASLLYSTSKTLARLAGRSSMYDRHKNQTNKIRLLQQTINLMEKAKSIAPENSEFLTELGNQHIFLGNLKAAQTAYKSAMKLDDNSESALNGLIKAQLMDGDYESAEKQIEFLNEIQASGKNPELTFMSAVVAWRKYQEVEKSSQLLQETIEQHFKNVGDIPLSYEYFYRFNPDFLLEIARELLQHIGADPLAPTDPPSPMLTKAIKLLEILTRVLPGSLECSFLLAKAKYVANDDEGAQRQLDHTLRISPAYAEGHLLYAQLFLKQDKAKSALISLEQSLSHSFEIKDSPFYLLIKARVHEQLGENEEALKVIESAMDLPGVKNVSLKEKKKTHFSPTPQISLYDRVSLYLELANIQTKLNNAGEVNRIMQEGMAEFRGTSEEVRFIIANANFALKRGDPFTSLGLLNTISAEKPYFIKALALMAEIHLIYRSDKRMYINCYKRMAESHTVNNLLLLGDAYMRIQEPDEAIKIYQNALEQNTADVGLISKIGKALIATHDYGKASSYYEAAVKNNPTNASLRSDLAELYAKLKKFDQADKVLRETLQEQRDREYDAFQMINDVKIYILMSKVHTGSGASNKVGDVLQKAHDLQNMVLTKLKGEQADMLREQKKVAANIDYSLAEFYHTHNNLDKAQIFYNEALRHDETHEPSILSLARLYLSRGELDPCQHQCITLLRMDAGNEEASMMLADLMFRKNEFDAATFHFQQLLEKKPTHYVALSRLIQLLRRAGKLSEVPKFLKTAEQLTKRASTEAGLHYCKGLYNRFTNNPRQSLTEFYFARKDADWGEKSLIHMIEIYLNPDNETLFEGNEEEYIKAVHSAKELLKELPQQPKTLRHAVLECYAQMSAKQKQDIEDSLQTLIQIVNQDRNYVPALLGIAQAYIFRKEIPKARNQLKRIAKMTYNTEDAEEFERSWLLLADIYIQMGKFDLAQELLKRSLNYNKSCAKAWELLGFIMEKEQSYRDASDHYEFAWKMENESNPTIGFRLAFNYLKAKRYVEAIDVCHKILTANPEYPKIRKEILDRARLAIRN